jgi:hypothetical protein
MSFTYFPQLPLEIRLKIWEAALPGPRIITIARPNYNKPLRGTCANPSHNATLKGLYFACHDSHTTMKKYYSLYFRHRIEHPIFFDPNVDILKFPDDAEIRPFYIHPDLWDMRQVRRVILPHPYVFDNAAKNFMSRRTSCAIINVVLRRFGNVKEISLMSSSYMNPGEIWGFVSEYEKFHAEMESVVISLPLQGLKHSKGLLDKMELKVLDESV